VAHILDDDFPRSAAMNDRERGRLLGVLHEICLDRANSDLREFAMTQAALALRATWEQVADAFGVSQDEARDRYAALRRRFGPLEPEPVAMTTAGPVPFSHIRGFVKVPDVMASGGHWFARTSTEWVEVWPGMECRFGGSDSGPDFALINFRLTPADGSP
jgi:hypothetical protein